MNSLQTVPIANDAVFADISDGDFRTYAIICQQAWTTSPDAEKPFVELSHAQIADLHPRTKKPAANTIRVRIQRLVAAGLLKRERVNNVRWRTRPLIALGGGNRPQTEYENHPQLAHLGDRPAIGQQEEVEMGDRSAICQSEGGDRLAITHPQTDQVADLPAITQAGDNSMGDLPANTQAGDNSVGDQPTITQNAEMENWVIAQRTVTAQNGEMGDRSTRGHPLDTDLIDFYQDQEQLKTKTDQINQTDQALTAQLATLRPEAMSATGIEECLQQPELTAAWLAYVTDPANGVRKPAAYLRRQVRQGSFPPQPELTLTLPLANHGDSNAYPGYNQPHAIAATGMAVAAQPATRWPLDVC